MTHPLAFLDHVCPSCGGRCCGRVPADGDEFDCHDQYGVGCKYRGHESEWCQARSEGGRIAKALRRLADKMEAENKINRPWEDESQRAVLLRQAADLIERKEQ